MCAAKLSYASTLIPAVVFEDDEILVLNKPSGLLVLPDRYDPTVSNLFDSLNEQYGRIFVVHRIDKETSGLIVFAKTEESHRSLNGQFEERMTEKIYAAICMGETEGEGGEIDLAISGSSGKKARMRIDPKAGKEATTNYSVIEHFTGHTLVEARPKTGRTHQIRVHLSSIGLPILGDSLYGGGEGFYLSSVKPGYRVKEEEKPLLSRVALHAERLSFSHPKSGERLAFKTELPKDMNIVCNYLRKYRGK
jgi:RluA family pseudouridine synthase